LSEPQGVAYIPFADSVFVANAGDGSVRVLGGKDLTQIGRIELDDDAGNVRVDTARKRVLVGYGQRTLSGGSWQIKNFSRCDPAHTRAAWRRTIMAASSINFEQGGGGDRTLCQGK
jgi:hypothetical protein